MLFWHRCCSDPKPEGEREMYYGDYAWAWWVFWVFVVIIPLIWMFAWTPWRGRRYYDNSSYFRPSTGGYGYPGGPYHGVGPRGYIRSDERIRDEINDRLMQHGEIDSREIDVAVQDQKVILRGTVDSRRSKRVAEEIADSVMGVADVQNELRIGKLSEPDQKRLQA